MLLEESEWIKQKLQILSCIENAVDIGASTLKFRTKRQPFIEKNIYQTLKERGIKVSQLDAKKEEGVDIVCDISDRKLQFQNTYDLAICTNLLEHVEYLDSTIDNITKSIKDNGYLIVTVPFIYPYHPDPIDNTLRFSIDDLEKLFNNLDVISAETLDIESKMFFNRFLIGVYSVICILRDMKFNFLYDVLI